MTASASRTIRHELALVLAALQGAVARLPLGVVDTRSGQILELAAKKLAEILARIDASQTPDGA